jgi:single-strand DNA-binding protein
MNFNKAVVVGRLTRDPETRTLPSGQPVASFSVATNRIWVDQNGNKQETTEYHNIVTFGKLADICSRYLAKGRLVLIEGRLQTRSWQDQDGNKRYRTEIIADNMQMGPRVDFADSREEKTPPEPLEQQTIPQEEIPVIEADEAIGEDSVKEESLPIDKTDKADTSTEKSENAKAKDTENKEEVDVKNIPF